VAIERTGYFWDVMEGRKPMPPAAALLGFELLAIDPELATIRVRFEAKPEFANPTGYVQGGFLAAMLDETLGPALVATLSPGHFAPTIELKVNYVRGAKIGRLVGEGRVVAKTKSIAFLAGELRDEAGKLIATATATARILENFKNAPGTDRDRCRGVSLAALSGGEHARAEDSTDRVVTLVCTGRGEGKRSRTSPEALDPRAQRSC
jgi:uncharacterized protein (TIGR00369 family)